MQIKPKVSIYLDTRSSLNDGTFPVKLRVAFYIGAVGKMKRVVKYYPCSWEDGRKIHVQEKLFTSAMKQAPLSYESRRLQGRLKDLENAARNVIKQNEVLNIEIFERLFHGQ